MNQIKLIWFLLGTPLCTPWIPKCSPNELQEPAGRLGTPGQARLAHDSERRDLKGEEEVEGRSQCREGTTRTKVKGKEAETTLGCGHP